MSILKQVPDGVQLLCGDAFAGPKEGKPVADQTLRPAQSL
jgi:hypothetical protein